MKTQTKKVKNTFLFLCAALVLSLTPACSDETEDLSVDQLIQNAYTAAHEGRWEDTLKFSEQAYTKRPDDTTVRIMHALALENNGRDNDALETSRLAAEDAKSFLAQYTYARMLFQRKKYDQAQAYLKKALELKADDFNTLVLLQQTAANLKQYQENQAYCRKLMELFGSKRGTEFSSYIYNELALNILRGMPKMTPQIQQTLIEINRRASKADPASPELEWNQAIMYDFYFHDFTTAKKHYEKFLEMTEKYSGMGKERAAAKERLKVGN